MATDTNYDGRRTVRSLSEAFPGVVREIVPCFKAAAPSLALSPRAGKFEHADTGEHCARSEAYVGFFA